MCQQHEHLFVVGVHWFILTRSPPNFVAIHPALLTKSAKPRSPTFRPQSCCIALRLRVGTANGSRVWLHDKQPSQSIQPSQACRSAHVGFITAGTSTPDDRRGPPQISIPDLPFPSSPPLTPCPTQYDSGNGLSKVVRAPAHSLRQSFASNCFP